MSPFETLRAAHDLHRLRVISYDEMSVIEDMTLADLYSEVDKKEQRQWESLTKAFDRTINAMRKRDAIKIDLALTKKVLDKSFDA